MSPAIIICLPKAPPRSFAPRAAPRRRPQHPRRGGDRILVYQVSAEDVEFGAEALALRPRLEAEHAADRVARALEPRLRLQLVLALQKLDAELVAHRGRDGQGREPAVAPRRVVRGGERGHELPPARVAQTEVSAPFL